VDENSSAAEQARFASQLLAQGKMIDHWSFGGFTIALLAAVFDPQDTVAKTCFLVAAFIGLVQRYYAFRVGVDAKIFCVWANRWANRKTTPESDMSAFDQALAGLHPGKPRVLNRRLDQRIQGAERLLARQAAALLLQMILLMLGMVL